MEFHGIPWNCSCQRNWRTPSSVEIHGIPWNCSCQRNWRTANSMEFHGISWNCLYQQNVRTSSSMEFHGTAHVSEIGALEVPWNSMEFRETARFIEYGALLVPWNSMELLVSSEQNRAYILSNKLCHLQAVYYLTLPGLLLLTSCFIVIHWIWCSNNHQRTRHLLTWLHWNQYLRNIMQ